MAPVSNGVHEGFTTCTSMGSTQRHLNISLPGRSDHSSKNKSTSSTTHSA
ncbi:hypothetical protein INT45_009795, partial [Circinella minor]